MPEARPGRPPARLPVLIILLASALVPVPSAAEGDGREPLRLTPSQWDELAERGLRLGRDEISNEGDGGLLAAVVDLGPCDGALVGDSGLIATSYLCARQIIQAGDVPAAVPPGGGFVAHTWADEIPLPGRSGRLLAPGSGGTGAADSAVDLSLAWLPPPEIGARGGAADDRSWPLHRGDFALLRAWRQDGEGSARPLRPVRHLVIEPRGVRPGDLVLALGTGPDGEGPYGGWGTVQGYRPGDAVWLEAQSTLDGLRESYRPGERAYDLPDPVRRVLFGPEPGRWRQAGLDAVPAGFTAALWPPVARSGVPILDGRGRWVGIGLHPVTAGAAGEEVPVRTVAVDVRYLLWMLEQVDGAWGLMRDLGVEPRPPRNPEATPDVSTGGEP